MIGWCQPMSGWCPPTIRWLQPTIGWLQPSIGAHQPMAGWCPPTTGWPRPAVGACQPTIEAHQPRPGPHRPKAGRCALTPEAGRSENSLDFSRERQPPNRNAECGMRNAECGMRNATARRVRREPPTFRGPHSSPRRKVSLPRFGKRKLHADFGNENRADFRPPRF